MLSKEMRLLQSKWQSGQGWPKRLEWLEINNLRGWNLQRINFPFPIVALVGENGVGKSTILQAIASSYQSTNYYASDFFPDTIWETVRSSMIKVSVREGINNSSAITSVRKPTNRWRGNPERKQRNVVYVDLRRIQPIAARYGYARLAKPQLTEATSEILEPTTLRRLSNVIGVKYDLARFSSTTLDETRFIPVLQKNGTSYSGFHQGAGETTIAELFKRPIPQYSILLIDEFETSLHPRSQRRLIRDIAELSRTQEIQVVLTTHSPYVLEELPNEARVYIMDGIDGKQIITGVSPEFAMTKMDEESHPEIDIYVEDENAQILLKEILIEIDKDLVSRIMVVNYGAASVGQILGQMVVQKRFIRPTVVYIDGDQPVCEGCVRLPGGDAPERVVFEALQKINWEGVALRIGRKDSDTIDTLNSAMTLSNHHDWVNMAANKLIMGSNVLWQILCSQWAKKCLDKIVDGQPIATAIHDVISTPIYSSILLKSNF